MRKGGFLAHRSSWKKRREDTFEGLASPQVWRVKVGKSETAVAVRSRLVVNTAEAAIDAAVAGLGITRVLSYPVSNDVLAGKLEVILDAFEPEPWPVNLVCPARGLLPLKTRAFLGFATPQLRNALKVQ